MTHAFFDHGQDIDSWEIHQQTLQGDQAIDEFSGLFGFGEFLESDGLLEREFSHCRARDFRQMRAASKFLSHLVRERADVRAGRALDDEPRDAALYLVEFVLKNLDLDRPQLDSLFLARQLVRRTPFHFFRGKGRRYLFKTPDALRCKLFNYRGIQRRRRVRTLRLAIGIVRIRREAETEPRFISLPAPGIKLHEPRGPS